MSGMESLKTANQRVVRPADFSEVTSWRRACGCIKTSDKLKEILQTFPAPPPPSPIANPAPKTMMENTCISAYCNHPHPPFLVTDLVMKSAIKDVDDPGMKRKSKSWQVVGELVSLVQLTVMATALALYYVIYMYMQLVYFTLRSALYFHNADGPMKITIGVVTVTAVIVGLNILLRLEKIIGIGP